MGVLPLTVGGLGLYVYVQVGFLGHALELGSREEIEGQGHLAGELGPALPRQVEVVGHAPTLEHVITGAPVAASERVDPFVLLDARRVRRDLRGAVRVARGPE